MPPPEEVPLAFHDAGPTAGKEILTRAFPTSVLSMPEYLALGGLGRTGDLAFRARRDQRAGDMDAPPKRRSWTCRTRPTTSAR